MIIKEDETLFLGTQPNIENLKIKIRKVEEKFEDDLEEESINDIKSLINCLKGKFAIIRIGGLNTLEKEEIRDRYIDAVCACRSALHGGIVTGIIVIRWRLCITSCS